VRYFANLHVKSKPRLLDLLSSIVARPSLSPSPSSSTVEKDQALSLWKLTVYFLAYTIVSIEREEKAEGKKSSKKKDDNPDDFDWTPYRERCLRALLESLVLTKKDGDRVWVDLGKTWPVGVPDEVGILSIQGSN